MREITSEGISRWQGDLLAAGTGPVAVHKALALLGGILQRAAEAHHIPANPARLVRKARLPARQEVRALAPSAVEALRAGLRPRDATLVGLLAYAGLRPQEALGLRWRHVQERTLIVDAPKTRSRRTVRLLAPLRADLVEWRLASGRPPDGGLVIPGRDGERWSEAAYQSWRRRAFAAGVRAAGLEPTHPYALRHSFASLLVHEGRSAIYVARQLGHDAHLTMSTYGHVIDELEDAPRLAAEDAIRQARESSRALSVPSRPS